MKKKILKNKIGYFINLNFVFLFSFNYQNNLKENFIQNNNFNKWNNFIEQAPITFLLDTIFSDKNEKNNYLEKQKSINTSEYLKKIKTWFAYSNNVLYPQLSFWSDDSYVLEQQNITYDELFEENWLWFLFNLKKFDFVYLPKNDLLKSTDQDFQKDWYQNNLLNGAFYSKLSNNFISSGLAINNFETNNSSPNSYNEYNNEFNYFLLNSDGFLFNISMNLHYDLDKKTLKRKSVSLFSYIFTFPKILKNNKEIYFFSIPKYIESYSTFDNLDYSVVKNFEYENYYGKRLNYSFVDAFIDE